MKPITTSSAAMRLARTIASDILCYNPDKVAEGLENDDLFTRLADEIAEAREYFANRTSPEIRESHNFLDRAFVDVLIYRSADKPSACW